MTNSLQLPYPVLTTYAGPQYIIVPMKARILPCIALAAIVALAASSLPAAEPDPGFVAHEWGTFTSVQGSDGVQMLWNPRIAPELPGFVYDRNRPRGPKGPRTFFPGKPSMYYRQRMETPVLYFYSSQSRTVDVSIRFPRGDVTEWFPFQTAPLTVTDHAVDAPVLHWEKVHLLAGEPDTKGVQLSEENPGSHYYAARATSSTILQTTGPGGAPEYEKFLFYRGVGNDEAPLTVTMDRADSHHVTLTNSSAWELRNLFLFEVRDNGDAWRKVDRLAPAESREVNLPKNASAASLADLVSDLREALIGEGLYAPEASAMIKTWDSSWFSERGMRVLYTLPRPWADRVLPLQIKPAPRETTRVMVARAELITPETERALQEQLARYAAAPKARRPQIVAETRALGLGRFLEAALLRIRTLGKQDPAADGLAWELISAASAPPKPEPPPTAKN